MEDNDDALLQLDASTAAALASFWDGRAAQDASLAALDYDGGDHPLDVDAFKQLFEENWQLSQFWYDSDTAHRLTRCLTSITTAASRIAFVCCPTAYVAFQASHPQTQQVYLFEKDARFSKLAAGGKFVEYDLYDPLTVPNDIGTFDLVVVDPPFHSAESQTLIAETCLRLMNGNRSDESPKLVLLTGLSLRSQLSQIYSTCASGPLYLAPLTIKHSYRQSADGGLATAYGCFINFTEGSGDFKVNT